MTEKNLV